MHGGNLDSGLAQQMATIAAACAPERIEDHLDVRLGDGLEVNEFAEAVKEAGLYVRGLEAC
ncbi:MAG: hypothetical protein ACXWC5_31835, partial [Burkholderiales bacterium]